MNRIFLIAALCLLGSTYVLHAQRMGQAPGSYAGSWVNKREKRHLTISRGPGAQYYTINDWVDEGHGREPVIDAYKAWPKAGKLVMPASTDDLRAPYAELVLMKQSLLYRTKGMYAPNGPFVDSLWFVRDKR